MRERFAAMPHDTFPQIVQLTPPGRGAVASMLVEGPGAVEIVAAHFRARNGRQLQVWPDQRLTIGRIGAEPGEEVVVRCHTAESVEIHCHGGHAAAAMIETLLAQAGCRPLGWKDWVAGRPSDPIAAAAQVALADARSERAAAILLDQYHGALRRAMDDIAAAVRSRNFASAKEQIGALGLRTAGSPLGPAVASRRCRPAQRGQEQPDKRLGRIWPLAGAFQRRHHPRRGHGADRLGRLAGGTVRHRRALGGQRRFRSGPASSWPVGRPACADLVLLVFDGSLDWSEADAALLASWPDALVVHNKSDLAGSSGGGCPAGLRVIAPHAAGSRAAGRADCRATCTQSAARGGRRAVHGGAGGGVDAYWRQVAGWWIKVGRGVQTTRPILLIFPIFSACASRCGVTLRLRPFTPQKLVGR